VRGCWAHGHHHAGGQRARGAHAAVRSARLDPCSFRLQPEFPMAVIERSPVFVHARIWPGFDGIPSRTVPW
jgi:hypothetical protein